MARQTVDERALLARVAAGDRDAFQALYQLFYPRLFAFVLRVTRRVELVEEVIQETMLVVWRKAATFDGRSRPSTWVMGIAYRCALKALRRDSRQEVAPPSLAVAPAREETPESLVARRERAGLLGRALTQLSPEQRAVVELAFVHGCSYPEVASALGCPVNTVKTRMFHARRRLREILPQLGMRAGEGS